MGRGRWTLTALCLATYMLLLDITIVQVALPSIGRDFHVELDGLQWAVDAYVLPLSTLVVTLGSVADRWGRRRVFLLGVAGFALASAACGGAQSAMALDVARAVQGACGAAVFATALALIGQEFSGPARGKAIIVWGSTVGAAVASGPLVGGALTEFASWRWIFFVNLPIGVATLALAVRFVGEGRDVGRALDVLGLLTLSCGLGLVTAGLLRGSAADWHTAGPVIALVAGGAVLVAFGALQRRPGAMIDRDLYRSRPFVGVTLATLGLGAGMFSMMLFLNIYLQNALGSTPLEAGLRLLPFTVPVLVVPLLARRAKVTIVSGRTIGVGLGLTTAGLLLMLAAGASTSWLRLLPGLVVAGIGVGLANPAIAATALAVVPPMRSGLASGVSNACRVAGITLGIAALGAVLRGGVSTALPGGAGHRQLVSAVSAGQLTASRLADLPTVRSAFDRGLHATFLAAAATLAVATATAFLLAGRITAPPPAVVPVPAET